MDVTSAMCAHGHEQVVLVADPPSGLRAVIAVHSTALGPSLGGVRFWTYASDVDAIQDVLALSEAMTWKASIAGLHQGGGKAVVLLDDLDAAHDEGMLRALGRAIDELGGRYLAAEDVGATTADMELLATVTPWVTGIAETGGGSGDPSPVTAIGVLAAIRAGLAALDGPNAALAGRRVAIQGAGKVGCHLAQLVTEAGGQVVIADRREDRADAAARSCGGQRVGADDILSVACDVLAPCALGGVLNDATVPRLGCRVVCGAANNQLAGPAVDEALRSAGIVYIPDFVASAGGIINIAEEFTGYSRARALARTATIEATTTKILARAEAEGLTTNTVALTMARERVEREGGGRRWEPGDPAAWTNGEPLRQLRPTGTVR
jgi:leucine dehydrogenase